MKTITKKSRRKRCAICKKLKDKKDVSFIINPYVQDIQGIETKENICTECYNIIIEDI